MKVNWDDPALGGVVIRKIDLLRRLDLIQILDRSLSMVITSTRHFDG